MSAESDGIIAERLARNQSFWLRAPVRGPLLGVAVNITFPLLTFADNLQDGEVTPDQIQPKAFLDDWDRAHTEATARGEDLMSVASPFAGIPWMEAIAGCTVRMMPGSGSVWAEYPEGFAINPRQVRFDPANAWLRKLVECTQALREHAAGRYPVGAPILRGVSDMIAAILGGNQMVLAYYDRPELIRELSERCTEIWQGVSCAVAEAKGSFMGGSCADRRRVWGRGTSLLYQDDAVALASPRFFREFFLPCIAEVLRPYTNTMIHLHSASLPIMARDLCMVPELHAIEVLLDPSGPQVLDLLKTFREILRYKALVICGEMTAQQVRACIEALPGAGLCLQPKAGSSAEADLLWREMTADRQAVAEDAVEQQLCMKGDDHEV